MVLKILITLIFILFLYPLSSATIINIPADYPAIQQGIDASADGDTVLVQPGTYYENINFNGHNIVLGSLFLTTGDSSYINSTIISGELDNVVTIESGEGSHLTGFTITAEGTSGFDRGIYCNNSDPIISHNRIIDLYCMCTGTGIYIDGTSSPIIVNNVISDNSSSETEGGGAIYCTGSSSPAIIYNRICDNAAYDGGGIYCDINSNPVIMHNIINGNSAMISGAGIYTRSINNILIAFNRIGGNRSYIEGGGIAASGTPAIIENNTISGNVAMDFYSPLIYNTGGGLLCNSADILVKNNLIRNNGAVYGGGIHVYNSNPIFINITVTNNEADSAGAGISCKWSTITLINGILWGNSSPMDSSINLAQNSNAIISYSDIQGGWPGTGNIDVDPLFRDPVNGDFHLMSIACGDSADSPCIDAGDPDILDSLLDCSWGLGGPRSDMGAYGGGDSLITGIFDNMPSIPDRFMLLQNYPNPFNAQTTIRFILPKSQNVELTIYDLLGRRVEVLMDEYRQAGVHTVNFDASDYPSGIYFARLETNNATKSIKMLLLK